MFNTNLGSSKCERRKCRVCTDPDCKGSTLCQVKSVVYESVCKLCEKVHKLNPSTKHMGRYVGETYRTLSERVGEHYTSLEKWENGSFMLKHWAIKHPKNLSPPPFKFRVLKKHNSPLSRLVHEAIEINENSSCNSKA